MTSTDPNNNQNQETEFYTGLTGDAFKARVSGHTTTFKYEKYENKRTRAHLLATFGSRKERTKNLTSNGVYWIGGQLTTLSLRNVDFVA